MGADEREICVVSVDPGVKTGVAWCKVPLDVLDVVGVASVVKARLLAKRGPAGEWIGGCGEIDSVRRGEMWAVGRLLDVVEKVGPDVVVIEDFVLRLPVRSMVRSLLSPVRVTAAFEFGLSMLVGDMKVVKQQPSAAMSVCSDKRMRDWGLWQKGKPHATDAIRHLVLYLRSV